jgi:hypothetical protein
VGAHPAGVARLLVDRAAAHFTKAYRPLPCASLSRITFASAIETMLIATSEKELGQCAADVNPLSQTTQARFLYLLLTFDRRKSREGDDRDVCKLPQ